MKNNYVFTYFAFLMLIIIEFMFFVIFVLVGFLVVSCGLATFFVIFLMSVFAFLLEKKKHFIISTTSDSSDEFTKFTFFFLPPSWCSL